MRPTRRAVLKGVTAGIAAASTLPYLEAKASALDGPRYLVVLGCYGGASILDSFLPVDVREAYTHPDRGTVISYPTTVPHGSNIRCVDREGPRRFLRRHAQHTVVMSTQASSVNHFVAQARSVNGREVFRGRTMAEAVAEVHGAGLSLPNVSMGRGGFAEPGRDATLATRCRAEAMRETDRITDALAQDIAGDPSDRLQAQAAQAYRLLRSGATCSVTLTEPGTDGFLAFDQSHQNHREAQATHWDRVLGVADRLIGLLADAPWEGPGGRDGTTMWDRTMIVFATEFGRDKWDPGSNFGSGHHLNNGLLAVSPLLRGNQALGEADPNNGYTTGWDPVTGRSTPFDGVPPGHDPLDSDERLPPAEGPVFGTLMSALGVSYEGQETLPVLLPG